MRNTSTSCSVGDRRTGRPSTSHCFAHRSKRSSPARRADHDRGREVPEDGDRRPRDRADGVEHRPDASWLAGDNDERDPLDPRQPPGTVSIAGLYEGPVAAGEAFGEPAGLEDPWGAHEQHRLVERYLGGTERS